jgi:hypothetical protein
MQGDGIHLTASNVHLAQPLVKRNRLVELFHGRVHAPLKHAAPKLTHREKENSKTDNHSRFKNCLLIRVCGTSDEKRERERERETRKKEFTVVGN